MEKERAVAIPGAYEIRTAKETKATLVSTHRGDFLVVFAQFDRAKTLLFQRHPTQQCWMIRRELNGRMEPAAAVSGHLLSSLKEIDIVEELEKRLRISEKAYWKLMNEHLSTQPVKKGRRSKRG
jgi:hypothetical protein